MRARLLDDIAKFHRQASKFIPAPVITEAIARAPQTHPIGPGWEGLEDDDESADTEEVNPGAPGPTVQAPLAPGASQQAPDAPGAPPGPAPGDPAAGTSDSGGAQVAPVLAEKLAICLPSHLGIDICLAHNLDKLVKAERRLRVGQMNDALHRVRVAVGYKSVLYRTKVRHAGTHRQKLRSFDDVHLVQADVLGSARLYTYSRESYIRLFKDGNPDDDAVLEESLATYRVLEKTQIKANTALIEHSVRGVSREHVPWFWALGMEKDSHGQGWSAECKWIYMSTATSAKPKQWQECYGCGHTRATRVSRKRSSSCSLKWTRRPEPLGLRRPSGTSEKTRRFPGGQRGRRHYGRV